MYHGGQQTQGVCGSIFNIHFFTLITGSEHFLVFWGASVVSSIEHYLIFTTALCNMGFIFSIPLKNVVERDQVTWTKPGDRSGLRTQITSVLFEKRF